MTDLSTEETKIISRRQAVNATGKALASLVGLAALPSLCNSAVEAQPPLSSVSLSRPSWDLNATETL